MGKYNQKRKSYFKKNQKLKQAKLAKEIADDEAQNDQPLSDQSDLEASDQESDNENSENQNSDKDNIADEDSTDSDPEIDIKTAQDFDPSREISNQPTLTKGRWKNKQRVLLIGSRGINTKIRHLIDNFNHLLPHTKTDVKINKQTGFRQLNEIAEFKNCSNVIFFEARKKKDTFMWLVPDINNGPSIRFLIENVHTTSELRFPGNCLARSRPLLTFHEDFDKSEELKLIKTSFMKVFNTPRYHPKSQPFVDHIFNFSILDNKIWFRNYQIDNDTKDVIEIGPRFTLSPASIFSKSFYGEKIWKSETFVSPNERRRVAKQFKDLKKSDPVAKVEAKLGREIKLSRLEKYDLSSRDEVFRKDEDKAEE